MKMYKYLLTLILIFVLLSCKKDDFTDLDGDDNSEDITANCELIAEGLQPDEPNTTDIHYLKLRQEIDRIASDLIVEVGDDEKVDPRMINKENYGILIERIKACEYLFIEEICFACDEFDGGMSLFTISLHPKESSTIKNPFTTFITINTSVTNEQIHVANISKENPFEEKDDEQKEIKVDCEAIYSGLKVNDDYEYFAYPYEAMHNEINRLASDLELSDTDDINPFFHEKNFKILLDRLSACQELKVEPVCYGCEEYYQWQSVFSIQTLNSTNVYTKKYVTINTGDQGSQMLVTMISGTNPVGVDDAPIDPLFNCDELYNALFEASITIYPPVFHGLINKIASNLKPMPTTTDPIGHRENLNKLIDRISVCDNLSAQLGCYACNKSNPLQSTILISALTPNGEKAQVSINLWTPKDKVMTVAGMGDKKDGDDDGGNGEKKYDCESLTKIALYDVKNMGPSGKSMLAPNLDLMLENLRPMKTNTDPYGHEKNLQKFVDMLNECKNMKAEIECYACMESYPPQSAVILWIDSGANLAPIQARINLRTDPDGPMTTSVSYK
jgi:hypothetical protein